MSQYWAACYTKPLAEREAQRAIEDLGFGTFIPSYQRGWYKGYDFRSRRLPLMPGYVLVALEEGDDSWNRINSVAPQAKEFEYVTTDGEIITVPVRGNNAPEAFCRILINAGQPRRLTDQEMYRLTICHATGAENTISEAPRARNGRFQRKRRRRPRPGKTMRNRAHFNRRHYNGNYDL